MKSLVVCFLFIALSLADVDEILQPNSTVSNTSTIIGAPGAAINHTFEVFSLNSYDHQNPLIIRSNVPDELKPSEEEFKNVNAKSPSNFGQITPRFGALSLPLPYSSNAFAGPTSSYSFGYNVQAVPTIKIEALSNLSPLLNSQNPFAAGVMSFDFRAPHYPVYPPFGSYPNGELSPLPSYPSLQPSEIHFEPAHFPAVDTDHFSGQHGSPVYYDYVINKVPEVASLTKPGQFTESDIPTIQEFEAIFNKKHSSDDSLPTVVEARFKEGDTTLGNANQLDLGQDVAKTTTELPSVTESTTLLPFESNNPTPVSLGIGELETGSNNSSGNASSIWDFVRSNGASKSSSTEQPTVESDSVTDTNLISQNVVDAVLKDDGTVSLNAGLEPVHTLNDATSAVAGEPETTTLSIAN